MAIGFKLLPPQYVMGEKDWVYGILCKGRRVSTGDLVSIEAPLTLMIGNGQYDAGDDIDYVEPEYQMMEGGNVDEFEEVNDGFLIEVDERAERDSGCVFTYAPHINYSIEIKEPEDVSFGDENYNYITNFLKMADDALFSENFTDPNEGWQKYMDIDSFVDWYIIHEISKNEDSMFHFSTYMNLQRGGKLKMGPIWDFDIAFIG